MRGHARPFRLLVPTTMLAVAALTACSGAPSPGSQPAATQGPTQSATVASDAVATPATTAGPTSSVAAPRGTASPTPSPVAPPTATAPGPSGGTADIYGTISYRDELETHSGPNEPQSDTHHLVVDTINVLLTRNPSGTGEYVDAGSTYSTKYTYHGVNVFGTPPCESITDYQAEVVDGRFGVPIPPAPESTITAIIDRDLGIYLFNIDLEYPYTGTVDDCGTHKVLDTSNVHTGGALQCGLLGLTGNLIEVPSGPDQLDMACTLTTDGGATTVSGILTIAD